MANTTGVVRFDHIQEKLGQIWNMVELTRSAIVAAEAGSALDEGGVWYPDDRPFLALRGEMPKWMPRVNDLLQLIGGGGFMCTPSEADLKGPIADLIAEVLPGRRRRRRAPHPPLPSRLGLRRLRPRRTRRAVRALLPLGLVPHDGARLQRLRQEAGRRARRAVPRRLTDTPRYSLPRSPEGRASLVPPPPWHYVGDFLVLEFWADPDAVAAVLPPGLEPFAEDPGRAAALFVDWQSCTGGRDELVDPARSQYREFFIVVNATARRRARHDLPLHLGRP